MSLGLYVRLGVGVAILLSASVSARAQPPVEAFGSLPAMEEPVLSPDGKHFAVIQAFAGKPVAAIYKVGAAPGTPPALVSSSDGVINTLQWANNDRLLIILKSPQPAAFDGTVETWTRTQSVNVEGKDAVMLLRDNHTLGDNLSGSSIVDLTPEDDDHILMGLFGYPRDGNGKLVVNLYSVNVRTGQSTVAQYGTPDTADWITDGHGKLVAMVDVHRGEMRQRLKLPTGSGDWREIMSLDPSADGEGYIAGLTEDGGGLALINSRGPTRTLVRADLTNAKNAPVLFSHPSYDLAFPIADQWTRRIIGAAYATDKMEYVYFDPERQKLQLSLEAAFPGRAVYAISSDLAHKVYIVGTDGPREPVTYYYFDAATRHAYALGTGYPMLAEGDLGEMFPYSYSARDGLRIPAYLTLPPGGGRKGLPLVVYPHGGPEARDMLSFDWLAQFLANRGYAVFQPNFRGSSGYGDAMMKAGLQQWGRAMQDDVTDGVKQLIADGTVDPNRICILGASYGGYAALAGAAFTPDLYKCAISVAGVSDLGALLDEERRNSGRLALSYWEARIGKRGSAELDAISPALHADQVRAPVLLIHAANDATVPINQSERMRDALSRANKPVEFVALEGDDHYLALAATRIRMLKECERFLAANIGGAQAAMPAQAVSGSVP